MPFASRTHRLRSSLVRDILAVTQHPDMISLAGGLPAPEALATLNWAGVPASMTQYGASEGEWPLRVWVAEHGRKLGLDCTPEQVLITAGSQQGIDLIAKLMVEPGTPVVLEQPTYLAALQVFDLFGADLRGVPSDPWQLDLAAWGEHLAQAHQPLIYINPTFQNPSGACYDAAQRQQLAALFDRSGGVVLEDDPYRELSYGEDAPLPLCGQLRQADWVYQGSFSKIAAPGLRLGFLIASPRLVKPLTMLKQGADLHSNRPGQWLLHHWLTETDWQGHIRQMRDIYRRKRDVMTAALHARLGEALAFRQPQGGLFVWAQLSHSVTTERLLSACLAHQVAVMPGAAFYLGQPGDTRQLRINFSHASEEKLVLGVERLALALAELEPR